MTTEPLPPADDTPTEPEPAAPARTLPRPSRGVVFALLGAFLFGGLLCGGLGLAAGVMIGHHGGRHEVRFDEDDREDLRDRKQRLREQPWLREQRQLPDQQKLQDLRDQELKRQLLERLRLRGRDGALPACPPAIPAPAPVLPTPSPVG
ncbi:hypothetical protein [Catellatospora sp. NPDC049609]|uniref:hypothetical protein n=1 Tax=Catellatospora sp. NPDC049609 TaxID=3155505 RepID=UPI00342D72BC